MLTECEFKKELSAVILKLRYQKRYSLEKLAELSETDYSSVNLIVNGKQCPKAYTLYKILMALEIDVFYSFQKQKNSRRQLETSIIRQLAYLSDGELCTLSDLLHHYKIEKK